MSDQTGHQPEEQAEDEFSFEIKYLDPGKIRFVFADDALQYVDEAGVEHPRVTLRRCFPLSAHNTHIMVCTPGKENERGKELGVVKDVQELAFDSEQAILRELALHYFVPVVSKINSIREEFGFLYWSVETDRGRKDFIMRDSVISAVRRVSKGRWLIIDINQTRYEIRDFDDLDTKSQQLLQRFLLL